MSKITTHIDNEIVKSTAVKMMFMIKFAKKIESLQEDDYNAEVDELGKKWYESGDNYSTLSDAIISAHKYANQCLDIFTSNDAMAASFDGKVQHAQFQHVIETANGDRDSILDALIALK